MYLNFKEKSNAECMEFVLSFRIVNCSMLCLCENLEHNWLTNTTILPRVSSGTTAVIIIHSICAVSSILAWPIRTIVHIFKKTLRKWLIFNWMFIRWGKYDYVSHVNFYFLHGIRSLRIINCSMQRLCNNLEQNWLSNTTIPPRVTNDTAAVIIIHSICAASSIFARSISTIVEVFRKIRIDVISWCNWTLELQK